MGPYILRFSIDNYHELMTHNRQGGRFCVTREFTDRLLGCVDGCLHVKLPGEIGKFTNPQKLNLSNNELKELPREIGQPVDLGVLICQITGYRNC